MLAPKRVLAVPHTCSRIRSPPAEERCDAQRESRGRGRGRRRRGGAEEERAGDERVEPSSRIGLQDGRGTKGRSEGGGRLVACTRCDSRAVLGGRVQQEGVEACSRRGDVVSSDGAVTLCSTSQGVSLRGEFFPVLRVPLDPPRTQTHGIRLVIAHDRLGVRGSTRLEGVAAGVAGVWRTAAAVSLSRPTERRRDECIDNPPSACRARVSESERRAAGQVAHATAARAGSDLQNSDVLNRHWWSGRTQQSNLHPQQPRPPSQHRPPCPPHPTRDQIIRDQIIRLRTRGALGRQ